MPRITSRRTTATLLSLACLVTLAACGGGSSGTDEASSPPNTVAGVHVERDEALHAALPASVKDAGVVRVATDVPYPPFEMFVQEGDSQLTGLDYDLGQALGAKLGVEFEFTPQKFDGIVPAIQAGKFDVAMSAITDTAERQEVVDFVDYSVSGSGILVAEGNPHKITSLDDLCGKKVGVQAATNQLDLLKGHQSACEEAGRPKIDIRDYPKDSDAQLALRSGQVVADILTKPAAGWTAKTADDGKVFDVVDDPAATGGYNATPNGIAVSKDLPELTEAIRQALQQLIDDGTVKKIFDQYGVASIALDQATVNAGKA
ncbi:MULTISPECIES: ABC transporter substrate-binding protein [unclassified Streptomyces]|uniref:ABC transporter substrate-binding protein n=1 Tax=unclassified Streptomyces TaxID=2593676 RepID=UPI0022B7217A|nr:MULTISPECIES: ABC transporter substrate-binding protein [unclassified Streptomyces]MCZ7415288.1 ABC transporter substrate-binding protein [Streptomyces sp. WMMC897]MCZ7432229.1 ABC transporter substrate-binding protein [Streptomyces sp. WMMC1477]